MTGAEVAARVDEHLAIHWLEQQVQRDVFPEAPYRVDYFNDDGQGRVAGSFWVQRVWVDLDRDGRWDEKWDRRLVQGTLVTTRRVSPSDDDRFTQTWVDDDQGRWRLVAGETSR